jgi:putative hydrolase of the HAD superfamily
MRFSTLFFDLDDTLYPSSSGLWPILKQRMSDYMRNSMGIPAGKIAGLREKYFREYGTTLRGLQANHVIDTVDYLAYVHDVPLEDYLTDRSSARSSPRLGPATDLHLADSAHARRVSLPQAGGYLRRPLSMSTPWIRTASRCRKLLPRHGSPESRNHPLRDDRRPAHHRAARKFGMFGLLYGAASRTGCRRGSTTGVCSRPVR